MPSSNNTTPAREPVSIAQLVHLVLAALVALGWANLDDTALNIVGSAVAGIISLGVQLWARSRVTPTNTPGALRGAPDSDL